MTKVWDRKEDMDYLREMRRRMMDWFKAGQEADTRPCTTANQVHAEECWAMVQYWADRRAGVIADLRAKVQS